MMTSFDATCSCEPKCVSDTSDLYAELDRVQQKNLHLNPGQINTDLQ